MNIENLANIIEQFETEVIHSGFKRDLQDYMTSLPSSQNNIVTLREIATNIISRLDKIIESDLPLQLRRLLRTSTPFTETESYNKLTGLLNDKSIDQAAFFAQLQAIISKLNPAIQSNIEETAKIKEFITPYVTRSKTDFSNLNKAVVSIIFNDLRVTSNLTKFSKSVSKWNAGLHTYHRLLKSTSPEDPGISAIETGSIDFIVNFDVDIAINLAEVFAWGFKAYLAYLTYKKLGSPIAALLGSFNTKKIDSYQDEIEKEILKNIETAVEDKLLEQHNAAKTKDANLDSINAEEKIKEVRKLVISHIVHGNDLKLLSYPKTVESEIEQKAEIVKAELLNVSQEVRSTMKFLPAEVQTKLIEQYGDTTKASEDDSSDAVEVKPKAKKSSK